MQLWKLVSQRLARIADYVKLTYSIFKYNRLVLFSGRVLSPAEANAKEGRIERDRERETGLEKVRSLTKCS
jgi:hypothetical protein